MSFSISIAKASPNLRPYVYSSSNSIYAVLVSLNRENKASIKESDKTIRSFSLAGVLGIALASVPLVRGFLSFFHIYSFQNVSSFKKLSIKSIITSFSLGLDSAINKVKAAKVLLSITCFLFLYKML